MFLTVDSNFILAVVVAAFSLFFDYFPGVSQQFEQLSTELKRLITVGVAVLTAVAIFIGQCYGWFQTNLVCSPVSAWELLYGVVIAVAVMYGFHRATKPSSLSFG